MTLKQKPGESKKEHSTRLTIAKRTLELMTAALALVAGLAWNDAIQTLFRKLFGEQSGLIAKFVYAGFITAVIVLLGFRLSKMQKLLEERLNKSS